MDDDRLQEGRRAAHPGPVHLRRRTLIPGPGTGTAGHYGAANLRLLRTAGTLIHGRRWFVDEWASWSAVAADDSAGPREQEIVRLVTSPDSLVISDSLTADADAPWASTTRIVPRAAAAVEIRRFEATGDRDPLMIGSGTTWNAVVCEGLVDELVVLVGAGLAGGGSSLYSGPAHSGLQLLDESPLPGSQLVRLRYVVGTSRPRPTVID